jgi:hypothetical protein
MQREDRMNFDLRLRLECRSTRLSSDVGLKTKREHDNALWLSGLAAKALRDTRRGKNPIHRLDGLFRQKEAAGAIIVESLACIIVDMQHCTVAKIRNARDGIRGI